MKQSIIGLYVIDVDKTGDKEYTYKSGNISMKFEYYDKFDKSYTVTIHNVNNEISTYKEERIPLIDSQIYVYSDGYIPCYNELEGFQGWF